MFVGLRHFRIVVLSLLLAATTTSTVFAKGSDVQFHGNVTRVELTATPSITVRVMGFDIVVGVTPDTEVESHGDEVELADIQVGNFLKISGYFAKSGITAKQIVIIDRGDGEFRLRGRVSAVRQSADGQVITVLGIDVHVNADTIMGRRGADSGSPATDLTADQVVDAIGFHREDQFIATRVKVGDRQQDPIRVAFGGKITAVATDSLSVDTEGGSSATVILTPTTIVTGNPAVDLFVEVRGTLNSKLEVVATRVNVKAARDDDDDVRPMAPTRFEKAILILPPAATKSLLRGAAHVKVEQKDDEIHQEIQVAFERAQGNAEYTVRIETSGGAAITLGTVRTNVWGRGGLERRSPPRSGAADLAALLPPGKTIREITKVQIVAANGEVVAEGTF